MAKRKPRIISKSVAERAARKKAEGDVILPPTAFFSLPPKTHLDEIYSIIEEVSTIGNAFADEDGRPWIDKNGITDEGDGVYVIRFRCPIQTLFTRYAIDRIVEQVCSRLRSEVRYFCKEKEEEYLGRIRLPFYECVWVIKEGELDEEGVDVEDNNCESCIDTQEEIEGELSDESTAEEVDERFEETLNNFV